MVNNQWRNRNAASEYTKTEFRFINYLQEWNISYCSQVHIELPLQPEEERTRHIIPDFVINKKIIVFIDGSAHDKERIRIKDNITDDILTNQLNKIVLRIPNEDVMDKSNKENLRKLLWSHILKNEH